MHIHIHFWKPKRYHRDDQQPFSIFGVLNMCEDHVPIVFKNESDTKLISLEINDIPQLFPAIPKSNSSSICFSVLDARSHLIHHHWQPFLNIIIPQPRANSFPSHFSFLLFLNPISCFLLSILLPHVLLPVSSKRSRRNMRHICYERSSRNSTATCQKLHVCQSVSSASWFLQRREICPFHPLRCYSRSDSSSCSLPPKINLTVALRNLDWINLERTLMFPHHGINSVGCTMRCTTINCEPIGGIVVLYFDYFWKMLNAALSQQKQTSRIKFQKYR